MSIRLGMRRDGGTLRARLLALVLVPLLGLTAFAAWEVQQRSVRATNAKHVESLVATTARVAEAQQAVLGELVPSMARVIVRVPALASALGLSGVSVTQLGLTAANVAKLRSGTDAALAALARDPRTAALAAKTTASIATMRRSIDSVVALTNGFYIAQDLFTQFTTAQAELIAQAFSTGLDTKVGVAVSDLDRVTQLVQYAELEIADLTGAAYPSLLAANDPARATRDWLRVWGGYKAVHDNLLASGSAPIVNALRKATSSPTASSFDNYIDQAAVSPGPIPGSKLISLYLSSEKRDQALDGVLSLALSRVQHAAAAQRDAAVAALSTIIGIVLGLALLCALLAWWILRSVSRPLGKLASGARKVSEGILDDVEVGGPREVRTAARGLAAAVASLRNIEAQAAAVAAGELDSDVVRRALPGPLGQVVHASVETIIGAIHERDAAQSDLAYRAAHDPLTELTNRAQAMTMIERSLQRARRNGTVTALMFIDLDHFKAVNDALGHEAGDTVLVTCAQRMKGVVRGGDTVARLGGDEFVILLEDVTSGADVANLAQRVVDTLAEPIQLGHRHLHVGASVGVAICSDAYIEAGRLLNEADAAAYQAKKDGRGRFNLFDDALREELSQRAELEQAMARALVNDEFVLYYQPVVDLRTGRPQGVEALIRWNRPDNGMVPPNDFIPVAEASALINEIGRWTLIEATQQLARWDELVGDLSLTMAVNISGRHLSSDALVADVRHALEVSGIAPGRLVIELTETVLVENLTATGNLLTLRELGVQVAIDDFGTGFTSIGQLLRLPIDTLKIDRSFVASTDPTHRELVHLMARAAHAFGLSVVAEGVEYAEQLDSLAGCSIDSAQGFLYARPQAAEAALELIRLPSLPVHLAAMAELPAPTR